MATSTDPQSPAERASENRPQQPQPKQWTPPPTHTPRPDDFQRGPLTEGHQRPAAPQGGSDE